MQFPLVGRSGAGSGENSIGTAAEACVLGLSSCERWVSHHCALFILNSCLPSDGLRVLFCRSALRSGQSLREVQIAQDTMHTTGADPTREDVQLGCGRLTRRGDTPYCSAGRALCWADGKSVYDALYCRDRRHLQLPQRNHEQDRPAQDQPAVRRSQSTLHSVSRMSGARVVSYIPDRQAHQYISNQPPMNISLLILQGGLVAGRGA